MGDDGGARLARGLTWEARTGAAASTELRLRAAAGPAVPGRRPQGARVAFALVQLPRPRKHLGVDVAWLPISM